MVNITIIDREGKHHPLEVPSDMNLNLMELCKSAELPVEGTCGGIALCASCQCYVLSAHELPEKSEAEEEMLDQAFFVQPNSRLGCQIQITDSLDNLVIHLAPDAN